MIRPHLSAITAELRRRVRRAWFLLTCKGGAVVPVELRKPMHDGKKR